MAQKRCKRKAAYVDAEHDAALAELTNVLCRLEGTHALLQKALALVAGTCVGQPLHDGELAFTSLAQQLVAVVQQQAIVEERQRLARDLHDSVTQALYSITLHAEVVRRLLAAGEQASAADNLDTLQQTAQEALDEMRLLIFELRPPILEQAGLVAALQARLDAVEGRAQLQTSLRVEGRIHLAADVEQALYRIAQEALNNTLKHARAQHIGLRLSQTSQQVVLAISDDGVGFDPRLAEMQGGFGLRGIAERVAQIGGQMTLESVLHGGTTLRVEVPL